MQETSPSMSVRAGTINALRWGISSLGCPELTMEEICALAGRFGIHDLELRSVADRLDLPTYLDETYPDAKALVDLLAGAGQQVVSLDTSFKLIGGGGEDREALLRFVPWAEALDVPFLRVFGGGSMENPLTDDEWEEACGHFEWWARNKGKQGWNVDLILETHDGFSSSDRCLQLQSRISGELAITWDTHHTWKLGGEDPQTTWDRLGSLVRHVHIKDSISVPSARHPYSYVLPGEGEFPAMDTLRVLADGGYRGAVCLEWEQKWHPYLPPIDHALAALSPAGWRS